MRRWVSRNGATTWTATVSSSPSSVRTYPRLRAPALWMRTSRRVWSCATRFARSRTSASRERSARSNETSGLSVLSTIAFTVDWPRDSSRPTTMTTAPNPASPWAIERPMPDVAPVTRTTRPSTRSGGAQCSKRLRAEYPIRE